MRNILGAAAVSRTIEKWSFSIRRPDLKEKYPAFATYEDGYFLSSPKGEIAYVFGRDSALVRFNDELELAEANKARSMIDPLRSGLEEDLQSNNGVLTSVFHHVRSELRNITDKDNMTSYYQNTSHEIESGRRELRFLLLCALFGNALIGEDSRSVWVFNLSKHLRLDGLGIVDVDGRFFDIADYVCHFWKKAGFPVKGLHASALPMFLRSIKRGPRSRPTMNFQKLYE